FLLNAYASIGWRSVWARVSLKKFWLNRPYFHFPCLTTAPMAGPGATVPRLLLVCALSCTEMPTPNDPQLRWESIRLKICASDRPCVPSDSLVSKKILILARLGLLKNLEGMTQSPST